MKLIKRSICIILMLSVVLSLSACSAAKLSHEKLCKFFEAQDIDECEDFEEYCEVYGKLTNEVGGYLTLKDKKAQKIYDKLFNRLNSYHDYDVTEATSAFVNNKDGYLLVFLFTFEEEKDAGKAFRKYKTNLADDGKENDLQYAYSYTEKKSGKDMFKAAYLYKNTVLIIQANTKDMDLAEELCKEFKLPNDF